MKVCYGLTTEIPACREPELSPALEAQRTGTGLRSRRVQVRILLRAHERTWRNGQRTCLIRRRLVVRLHPFVLWPWSKKRTPGCEPGGTGVSPVGHPTGESQSGAATDS